MREGRYFKTTQAKKYTVADLIKRYLDYQKTRNPKRANAVEVYLDWWKSEIGAYALADVTKNLIIEKREAARAAWPCALPKQRRTHPLARRLHGN